jgi:mannose-1-phosphate guanylyltransferase
VRYSHEEELLGTGGGLLRAAEFLRESDPAVVLAGDMLLDLDLGSLVARHRERGDLATLVLRADPRMREFGSIGFDREGRVRRVGKHFDLGGETDAGLFTSVRLFSPEVFDWLGEHSGCFEDLRDVLVPALSTSNDRIRVECVGPEACAWEPVGTPLEYLQANFGEADLVRSQDARAQAAGVHISPAVIVGSGAEVGPDCELERVVVWSHERVPAATRARNGVFANGGFHPCVAEAAGAAA